MLYVTRKHGRSLVNFIPWKSRFHSFSLSAFGPKATRRGEQMTSFNHRCLSHHFLPFVSFFKKGNSSSAGQSTSSALKLVGRLLYRLTIGGHIFMVWNLKLYDNLWGCGTLLRPQTSKMWPDRLGGVSVYPIEFPFSYSFRRQRTIG